MGKVGAAVKILLDIETVLAGGRGAEPSPPPTAVPAAEPGDTPAAGQAGRFFELPEF
jgi:hypothetical protein